MLQFDNPNRPYRVFSLKNKLSAFNWLIETSTTRPYTCSHAISDEIVHRVMEIRSTLKRCAEVIWDYLKTEDGVQISLSSVRRILKRHHAFDGVATYLFLQHLVSFKLFGFEIISVCHWLHL